MQRLALTFLALFCLNTLHLSARQPNVVFILADDLGWADLGCYGQKIIQTPHLDSLAAEGMRFTQHYSGNTVCAPSRCVLMTGKHPGHADIRDNRQYKARPLAEAGIPEGEGQFPLRSSTVILPMILKQLGYTTGGFGKWGLGAPETDAAPLKRGFDRWYGFNCQAVAHNFYPVYLWDNDKQVPLENPPFSAHFKPSADVILDKPADYARFKGKDYSADLITEQALAFAKANKDKPFYLYWPTTVPHLALQVPDEELAQYAGKFDDPPYKGGRGYTPHYTPRAAYAAMITRMDRDIGRMVSLIRELGLEEDTLFVFSSDNGPLSGNLQDLGGTDAAFFASNAGRRGGKTSLYEAGVRVPCIVRWKGQVAAGQVSERVTGFEDWLPTLLSLVGAADKKPQGLDGIDFSPTLRGEKQPEREFLYREIASGGGQVMLRSGDWKLIRQNLIQGAKAKNKAKSKLELYDLAKDPNETTDVAATNAETVSKLSLLMQQQHVPNEDFKFPALDK